ncbi:MAG: hypothetical protein K2K04_00440 [Clostridia bacterium]|nr:hypothetical protein [Clostridia bacterium]
MKYCVHCGKQVLDDAIICPGCGCSVQYGNNGNNTQNGNAHNNNAQQYQVPPAVDTYSGLSVGGLILAFFEPLIGLILSILAHNEAKRTGSQKSRSMSTAGIIISAVIMGLFALLFLIWIIGLCSCAYMY